MNTQDFLRSACFLHAKFTSASGALFAAGAIEDADAEPFTYQQCKDATNAEFYIIGVRANSKNVEIHCAQWRWFDMVAVCAGMG
jgi:hypothetical protein